MPEIVIERSDLENLHGRRFLMSRLAAVMLFPTPDINRLKFQDALVTSLNINFYKKGGNDNSCLNCEDIGRMLEVAAVADMSLLNADKTNKNCSVGASMGLLLERMLYNTRRNSGRVSFWDDETIKVAANITKHISPKTRERNMTIFKPVLHFWAAAMRLAYERKEADLKWEEVPCDISELEKFIQYSEIYRIEGEQYKQPQNNHTIIPSKTSYKLVTKGFDLPSMTVV